MIGPSSFSLEGSRALVTGGAAGIGAAIAQAFAACGADVAMTVHERNADETVAEIRGLGRRAEVLNVDLATSSKNELVQLVANAEGRLGGLDILVNNAGIILRHDAFDHPWEDWRAVMAVDLDAVWLLSQAAARRMAQRSYGRIINIASILSFQGGVRVPAYAAAKHAVVGLTKALANEWTPHGVNVNAIAPGYVATRNTRALRADEERMRELLSRIPAGRFAEPDEIAGAAVFLASPAARYITGTVLSVDGGWLSR
ncbi:MAG: SDR family oxidoreductase [Propylenella sp.]